MCLNTWSIVLKFKSMIVKCGSMLFFVRGGGITPGYYINYAGEYGYLWSSRTYSSNSNAYYLVLYTSVAPSDGNNGRYVGHSLRCLIPTP